MAEKYPSHLENEENQETSRVGTANTVRLSERYVQIFFNNTVPPKEPMTKLEYFELVATIGKGGYGKITVKALKKQTEKEAVKQTDKVVKQTKEAVKQTDEAVNQTEETMEQTEEAVKQMMEHLSVVPGRVLLVRKNNGPDADQLYAMKIQEKLERCRVLKGIEHGQSERDVLIETKENPFIVKLHYAFKSSEKIYLVMDYMCGGDLSTWIARNGPFKESVVRFYIAEITAGLGYLHSSRVIYRGLKPENISMDDQGHIKLADFGLCKKLITKEERTYTASLVTNEYMAPEMLEENHEHGKEVDWWSMGVVMYEMFAKKTPFDDEDPDIVAEKIMKAPIEMPPGTSDAAKDLMEKLLTRNWRERIGVGQEDSVSIEYHLFFAGTKWPDVKKKQTTPPLKPKLTSEVDVSYFRAEITAEEPIDIPLDPNRTMVLSKMDPHEVWFSDFSYVAPNLQDTLAESLETFEIHARVRPLETSDTQAHVEPLEISETFEIHAHVEPLEISEISEFSAHAESFGSSEIHAESPKFSRSESCVNALIRPGTSTVISVQPSTSGLKGSKSIANFELMLERECDPVLLTTDSMPSVLLDLADDAVQNLRTHSTMRTDRAMRVKYSNDPTPSYGTTVLRLPQHQSTPIASQITLAGPEPQRTEEEPPAPGCCSSAISVLCRCRRST